MTRSPRRHRASRGRRRLSFAKKLLLSVMILGGIAGTSGSTLASLNGQTTNSPATFATGTLTLSNTVNSGTACLSANASTAPPTSPPSVTCNALVTTTDGPWFPGQMTAATIKILNDGSLDASQLSLSSSGCTSTATGNGYAGSGDPCNVIEVSIEETNAAGTPLECYLPFGLGTTCSLNPADTLSLLSSGAQPSSPVPLPGGLPAGSARYFRIDLGLPTWTGGAGNPYQGEQATFALTWRITY